LLDALAARGLKLTVTDVEAGNECFAALTDQIASWIQLGQTEDGSRPSPKP